MFPFKPNKQYTTIAIYVAAAIAISILFGVLLFNLGAVGAAISSLISSLRPLMYGIIIAYLTAPLVKRFERLFYKPLRNDEKGDIQPPAFARILAITAAFVVLALIIFGFVFFVIPLLVGDGEMLMSRLLSVAQKSTDLINTVGEKFGFTVSTAQLYGLLRGLVNTIATGTVDAAQGFATMLISMVIGLCLSAGILFHRRTLFAFFRHAGAAIFSLRAFRYIERLVFYSNRVFGKYLIGKIVECAIVGLLYLIVLPILGVPYPFLITVIMTITNFIPIIGAILGGIPCGILILTGDNPFLAIWFILIVLAVEQIDGNIIFPKVIGSIIDLRAVWIMVAVALFGGFFGVVGMFLSPPLFSIIYMLLRDITNHRLEKKGYPTETDYYTDRFAATAPPRRRNYKHHFFLGDKDHDQTNTKK